ncbi:MAG: hypothetical protein KAG99_11430 [Bacteroidales bacterium]|nr:hypothetical protein [Bacteroidales bacterium]
MIKVIWFFKNKLFFVVRCILDVRHLRLSGITPDRHTFGVTPDRHTQIVMSGVTPDIVSELKYFVNFEK